MTNPNEKEWYEDKKYWQENPGRYAHSWPRLEKIVAEAERRTWEEAKRITKKETVKWYQPNPGSFILDAIKVKLSSLTKK